MGCSACWIVSTRAVTLTQIGESGTDKEVLARRAVSTNARLMFATLKPIEQKAQAG